MYTTEPLSHLPEPQWLLDDRKLLSWWQNLLYIAEHDRLRRDYPGLFYVRTYDLAASWTRRDIYGLPEDDNIEAIAQFLRRLEADGIISIEYGIEPCTYSEITIIPAPTPKASAQTKNSAPNTKTTPANTLAAKENPHLVGPQVRCGRIKTNAKPTAPPHIVGPNGRFGRVKRNAKPTAPPHIVGPNGRFGRGNHLDNVRANARGAPAGRTSDAVGFNPRNINTLYNIPPPHCGEGARGWGLIHCLPQPPPT